MEIKMISLDKLRMYEKNPRKNDASVDYVANSIREFGWRVPVCVDKNMVIVAGHTRVKAAKKLGIDEVPCIVADDLTDEQIKAYRLADNKVGELSEWDFSLLDIELGNIADIDMSEFGFVEDVFDETDLDVEDITEEKFSCKFTFDSYNDYIKYENELKEYAEKIGAIFSVNKA